MIGLAGRAMSLVAAVAVTAGATVSLQAFVTPRPPQEIFCNCLPLEPMTTFDDTDFFRHRPPPLPKFIHSRAPHVKAPEILCEVPGDPTAVTDCGIATYSN